MSVEELIEELKKHPPHYSVHLLQAGIEIDDETFEAVAVEQFSLNKEVLITIGEKL